MLTHVKSVKIVGPSFIAVEDCAANSYHSSGDITGVYEYGCELFKKRIECAIMIKVAEEFKN